MKPVLKTLSILLALIYSVTTIAMAEESPMLPATPYADIKENIGKDKPLFLEVGAESCHMCQTMGKMLYKVKENNASLPIYFINIQKEREVAGTLKIMMIPTQIIYDKEGKEVYRHIGALKEEELGELLVEYGIENKTEEKSNRRIE